jgi:hypothetical protein
MNWMIIICETVIMTIAFTAMVLIPLVKNPVWWIHDYPKDIQEEYFKTHERVPSEFFSKSVLLKKGCALLVALVLMLVLMKLAGAYGFWSALALSYGIWLFIDWYDCFFLDWVLFANMKAVRLPGTEHMDKAYHQKRYHFVQSLWGMLIGLIPCIIGAAIYAFII